MFLPGRCWDSSGTRLLLDEHWGSVREVTLIDTDSGKVTNVSGHRKGAWHVLDVSCDLVVAQFASLNTYPDLVGSCVWECVYACGSMCTCICGSERVYVC